MISVRNSHGRFTIPSHDFSRSHPSHCSEATARPLRPRRRGTAEPAISQTAEQETLTSSTGSWTAAQPLVRVSMEFAAARTADVGWRRPCTIISAATGRGITNSYAPTWKAPNARRVTATNAQRHAGRRWPPARRPPSSRPREHISPRSAVPGLGFRRDGRSRRVERPWVDLVSRIAGLAATRRAATVCRSGRDRPHVPPTSADVNHRMRFNVTARNAVGSVTVLSAESPIVTSHRTAGGGDSAPERRDLDPCGECAPRPASDRLAGRVLEPGHEPEPARHGPRPRQGHARLCRPRRTRLRALDATGDEWRRSADRDDRRLGDVSRHRRTRTSGSSGYNVQFFVKAYRAGDPALAGIAGYRLVQVRTASR